MGGGGGDVAMVVVQTFCVKLAKPEGGLVWFQVKYYSLFTPTEAKEYEEYLSMISEQTFLDLFKKDRYGFALAESDMQVNRYSLPPPPLGMKPCAWR